MPKMKTHSGAKKRFKVTGSGKIKRKAATRNHIQAKRTSKNKRKLKQDHFIDSADMPRVKRMLNML